MKRFARVFSSITFRLVLIYTLIFGASVGGLFYYVFWTTAGFADDQTEAAVEAEVASFVESYGRSGIPGLIMAVNRRSNPNTNRGGIYLLINSIGTPLAGNLTRWPRNVEPKDIWLNFKINDLSRAVQTTADVRAKQYIIPGGYSLLVGRDVREAHEFRQLLLDSLNIGIGFTLALGILGGIVFSRTVMRRIESITRTCRSIMSGDLSQRVPVSQQNDELSRLSVSINAMLDQIERLMKGMQQVTDSVAHDLRTPLTRLRSRLEGLLRRAGESGDREAIEGALGDADNLLATFAALLRVARAEAGLQRNFVDIDLHAVAEEVADLYGPLADDKGLTFITQFEQGLTAHGDPNLVAQALANLIDNAIKYTEQGSVSVILTKLNGRSTFVVADTGPGVPDEYKGKVLERLFRMELSRTSPGSGLGLALVAAVAKSHGLDLKLSDNLPGLRVTLSFPLQQASVGAGKKTQAKPIKALLAPQSGDKALPVGSGVKAA